MEFQIGRDELAAELALCDSVVQLRQTMPILSTMLLAASKSGLSVMATDCETTIHSEVDASIKTEGSFCFPSKRLAAYVGSLPSGAPVSISVSKTWATITSGASTAKMPLLDPGDFPVFPVAKGKLAAIQCSELATTLNGIVPSISEEEGRSGSKDLCVDANHALTFVAMDHGRMPVASINVECLKECRILMSKKSAGSLLRVASLSQGSLEVYDDDRCASFVAGNRTITIQKISRGFPNYTLLLNRSYPHSVKLRAPDLRQSLERAMLFIDPRLPSIAMDLGDAEAGVCVSSRESGDGSGQDRIPYLSSNGKPMTAFFNPFFMMDFLRYAKDRDIEFLYTDRKSTCEFRISGIDSYRYFCMPKVL